MPNPNANMSALFPLTLALSLGERERPTLRCDESKRSGLAKAQQTILPLPKGEGRGEGEGDYRILNRL